MIELSDEAGVSSASYSYDAYGNQIKRTSGEDNAYRFSTKEYSSLTGLIYFGARYYDPEIGRFLTKDPLGFAGGINQYIYCESDPVNWIDPWGLCKGEKNWRWGEENWLWQYLHGGGELADPRFWLMWGEEFQRHRLSGTRWFSLLEWPWGLPVSYGLTRGGTAIQHATYGMTWSGTKFTSLGRSGLYLTGKRVGWQTFGTGVKGLGHTIGFVTAASTGADIGTWIYSYYTAYDTYHRNER